MPCRDAPSSRFGQSSVSDNPQGLGFDLPHTSPHQPRQVIRQIEKTDILQPRIQLPACGQPGGRGAGNGPFVLRVNFDPMMNQGRNSTGFPHRHSMHPDPLLPFRQRRKIGQPSQEPLPPGLPVFRLFDTSLEQINRQHRLQQKQEQAVKTQKQARKNTQSLFPRNKRVAAPNTSPTEG